LARVEAILRHEWIRRVNTLTGAIENQVSWRDMEDIRALTQSFSEVVTDSSNLLS
jgi:hypothetical protein